MVATWTGNETIDSGQTLIYGSRTAAGETGIHTVTRDRNVGKNIVEHHSGKQRWAKLL